MTDAHLTNQSASEVATSIANKLERHNTGVEVLGTAYLKDQIACAIATLRHLVTIEADLRAALATGTASTEAESGDRL